MVVKVNSILRWFFPLFSTHTYEINFYDVTPIQIHAKYELNNEKQSIYNKTALIDNFISHNHAVVDPCYWSKKCVSINKFKNEQNETFFFNQ